MIYLLVNHVPFTAGPRPGTFRVRAAMLADLRAQAQAIAAIGGRLLVAAPLAANATEGPTIVPDDEGFEYLPLPHYATLRQFWAASDRLSDALRRAIAPADVVQMDYGGHPVMLGEMAWPIAGRLGKRRVWVFDAVDPFPQFAAAARDTANPLRRAARSRRASHKLDFCRQAVAEADLVISLNPSIVHRFRDAWDERRCHAFEPPPTLADDLLLSPTALETAMRDRGDRRRPLRLLCAGRHGAGEPPISPRGGGDHALRVLAHCRRLSVPVTLTILDEPGPALTHLREMAGGLAMTDYVEFAEAAPAEATPPVLDRHDVLLVTAPDPRRFDPQISLAMARALGVVTYENEATDRILESNRAARVVGAGNVLLLAQAVIDLQQNRRSLIELAESGWRLAASRTFEAVHRRRAELAHALTEPLAR